MQGVDDRTMSPRKTTQLSVDWVLFAAVEENVHVEVASVLHGGKVLLFMASFVKRYVTKTDRCYFIT